MPAKHTPNWLSTWIAAHPDHGPILVSPARLAARGQLTPAQIRATARDNGLSCEFDRPSRVYTLTRPKRGPGRPRLASGESSRVLSLRLPKSLYTAAASAAKRAGLPLPKWFRSLIKHAVNRKDF
jgi:hypothetical protein